MRTAVAQILLLFLVFFCGQAPGQKIESTGGLTEVILLGQELSWTIRITESPEKPVLSPLPDIEGIPIIVVQDRLQKGVDGLWNGSWTLKLRPEKAGDVLVPPVSVLVGTEEVEAFGFEFGVERDTLSAAHAFLEFRPEKDRVWAGGRARVRCVFGWEEEWFAESVLQPFRRPLDVPIRLRLPWLEDFRVSREKPDGDRTLVFNDVLERWESGADEERNGKVFRTVSAVFELAADAPGFLAPPASLAAFRVAEAWQEDFINERVPTKTREAFVYAGSWGIDVLDPPESERPEGYSGSVGTYSIDAEADRASCAVGETVRITVTVTGDRAPRGDPLLPETPGFRLRGATRSTGVNRTVTRYDFLALTTGAFEIGPIGFVYFDLSGAGRYRRAESAVLPIRVDSGAAGENSLGGFAVPWRDADALNTSGRPSPSWLAFLLLLPWGLAAALWWYLKRRRFAAEHPDWVRFRKAGRRFHEGIGDKKRTNAEVFAEYLAAKLSCTPSQIYEFSLPDDLLAAGLDPELAREVGDGFRDLVDRQYRGSREPAVPTELTDLVSRMEQGFPEWEERS